jgi:hypothetical protein
MKPLYPSHDSMSRLLAAALLIPLLAACGSSNTPSGSGAGSGSPGTSTAASAANPSGSEPPASGSDAVPSGSDEASPPATVAQYLTCDPTGPGWSVSALDKPADAENGTTPAAKALKDFVTGADGGDLPDSGWRELYRSKELALYGQDDPSGEAGVLLVATIRASNGVWAGEDSSQCRPRTWFSNTLGIAADWKLSAKTTKTTKTLKTLVTERACASGESAKGRIAKPRINYEPDRIVITIGVHPRDGAQDCQSNPATPLTITLSEALGDRQLFDGGPYPAVEVAQPK